MLRIKKSKKSITKKLNYTVSSQNRLVFLRRRKLNLTPDFSICIYIILDNAELTRLVPKFVTSDTPNFITFDDAYSRGLKVMDMTAFTLCKENDLPIIVFDMDTPGNLRRLIEGEQVGTIVRN